MKASFDYYTYFPYRIYVTSDNNHYFCITSHSIGDESFAGFRKFSFPHTASILAN